MENETLNEQENLYIAIEGNIGAGKTTLARMLSERFEARLVLEKMDENPYVADFYQNPRQYAFITQINFLFMRYEQQLNILQQDLFHRVIISDYLFARDRIFASVNLEEREFFLYDRISRLLVEAVPVPDIVIYLQSSTDVLLENIRRRNRPIESNITRDYLKLLNEAYNQFFIHYSDTALLVINAGNVDFLRQQKYLDELIHYIRKPYSGTRYYNPLG